MLCTANPVSRLALLPQWHQITRRQVEMPGTVTLSLAATGGEPWRIRPGQFHMLYAPGIGEAPISVSGISRAGEAQHTIRGVGAVTKALCRLRPGQWLGIRGPYGTPWPLTELTGRHVLLIAGGIGLAPLRGALRELAASRRDLLSLRLFAGARSPREILYAAELKRLAARCDLQVAWAVDRDEMGDFAGRIGLVTSLLPSRLLEPAHTVALLCGPEVMMRNAAMDLVGRGVDAARIYLSLERSMPCGIGLCGHCQLGGRLLCQNGPVVTFAEVERELFIREL